jgi:hypothetical protein
MRLSNAFQQFHEKIALTALSEERVNVPGEDSTTT